MLLAASAPPLLTELAILLVAGTLIAFLSSRFGVLPIVGFLIAGAVIGPGGVGLIGDIDLVDQLADIGVMLLLFTLGIEFSLDRVRRLASLFLGGGAIQVGLTTGVVTAIVAAFGVDWRTSIFTGLLVSLSSTAIVLKVLAERRATTSPTGNMSVALLIFQDLAIVAMVLFVPLLSRQTTGPVDVGLALAKAVGIIVAVVFVARTLVPAILRLLSRHQSAEVFLLTILAICFGTAYVTSLLDVSISLGRVPRGTDGERESRRVAGPRRGYAAADSLFRDVLRVDRHAGRRQISREQPAVGDRLGACGGRRQAVRHCRGRRAAAAVPSRRGVLGNGACSDRRVLLRARTSRRGSRADTCGSAKRHRCLHIGSRSADGIQPVQRALG